jgi:hypothetical protein
MDELELSDMVRLLMCHLEQALEAGRIPENTQIVIRPVFAWPDGRAVAWVIVNTPN